MSCEATNLVFYVQSTSTGISGRGERERSTIIIQKSCDTDKYRRMAENRGIVGIAENRGIVGIVFGMKYR